MSQEQAKQYLAQGVKLAQAGQKEQARQYLAAAVKLDPQSELAWLWMSQVARDARERLFCLQNVLKINPNHEQATKILKSLGVDPAQAAVPAATQADSGSGVVPTGGVPVLKADQLNVLMSAVDSYLRDYEAIPSTGTPPNWASKTGGRYGEALARRRQATRYGAVGIGVLVVMCILFAVLSTLLSGGDAETIAEATPTNTHTPTTTPTETPGATNTPSPEPEETLVPFSPPANVQEGSIYGNPPTPIYPSIPRSLGGEFEEAVKEYTIGNYTDAFVVFQAERELANNGATGCIPDTYYYEILGLAEQGGRRNLEDARALYEDGLAQPACADSALLYAAACVVDYLTFLQENDPELYTRATGWCDASLNSPQIRPPVILATTTRARLYLLETPPNFARARATLQAALELSPEDVNLLLVAARVELQSGDLQAALNYISQALYIEPLSEPALRLRVDSYLDIAASTSDPDRQKQLYGTAVLWTQEYLLFYPGKPVGYLLLAQARLGEGKTELAEEALTRIINAKNDLPEFEQSVVQQAYATRAQLYLEQARYEEAFADTEDMLQTDPENLALTAQQAELAFRLGRYPLALQGLTTVLGENITPVQLNGQTRYDLVLLNVQLITETCQFTDDIDCNYPLALEALNEDVLGALGDTQTAQARAYRAKALYHVTLEEGGLSDNQRTRNLETALDEIEQSLDFDETAYNQYYRGLILEALGNPNEALLMYQWVVYWSQYYDYPFLEDVQKRIDDLS